MLRVEHLRVTRQESIKKASSIRREAKQDIVSALRFRTMSGGGRGLQDWKKRLEKAHDLRLAVRLLRYLHVCKWSILAAAALTILNAPLATAGPLLIKAAIDLFIMPDLSRPLSGYVLWLKQGADFVGLGESRHHGLIFIAILFLLAKVAQSAAQFGEDMLIQSAGQKVIHDLRQEIFSHLQKVPIQFYHRTPVGQLMARLTADVDSLDEMFSEGIVPVFTNAVVALYAAALMFQIDWSLALVSCSALLGMVILVARFRRTISLAFQRLRQRAAAMNAFLQEHLTGMQVIQIFTREAEEMRRFERVNREHWQQKIAETLRNALLFPAIEALMFAGIALIIWYGGGQVMSQAMGLGTLVAFVQLAQTFYDPIIEIGSRYHILQGSLAASERIFELLDEPTVNASVGETAHLGAARGRIEFRNVWFAYEDEDWILRNVSFTVEPGETVALVGRTGAGKTTITNLLLRFHEIQRGQIFLDGRDIRELHPAELRASFAVVPQDIFLFPGDITSNISLGNRSILETRVRAAARDVHLEEFIVRLEHGYQSEVFEGGAGLSVGQKQLVGFARALAVDRPILILDEATSSVDTHTESQIHEATQKIMAGRTAIVIAHRLSTIQSVDRILVMHKGEIRESGDHKSLLALRGLYWMLHQIQFPMSRLP
jgi:ATP-binding cassette, subfamily B, multidrug efflux pump